MPKLTINGREVELPAGTNLIEAAKALGTEIPHFCYHPGLSVAGNCRMCLVEIEKAPKLQIACNTPVAEGMVVLTESDKVKKARAGVMEFLLLNHPIDCPICDCAGECYLQDYYMEHDAKASRLEEGKNKKEKAQPIGPHVMLDKERCVLCSRCVRFTDEVSGTHELGIFGRGSTEEIGLAPGMTLDNAYSGNVVDLCPVGALTDRQFRFKSRPWFLKETATLCGGCSMGCNIVLNTNTNPYNKVGQDRAYRMFPRENKAVNGYWMCDEGRYSYAAIDQGRRARPLAAGHEAEAQDALAAAAKALKGAAAPKTAFLLHPSLTNEELAAFAWLAKALGVTQVSLGADLIPGGQADGKLIQADKFPNGRGAQDQGLSLAGGADLLKAAKAGALEGLLIVGHALAEADAAELRPKLKALVGAHSHAFPGEARFDAALALAHGAEQDGSWTNVQGRVQRLNRALSPLGDSQPGWALAMALGAALGHPAPVSAADAQGWFAHLATTTPAYAGLSLDGLGAQGALPAAIAAKA
jgi:NADH-quinone oxidoreductase subunit G